jgi:hypothetical protein
MAIFISYSHADKDFVDRLAGNLVNRNAWVWVDRWELSVGDSIINRVQEAIEKASALLVVLSKSSVASEWCKKEITAGLLRELEERRVVVLPVLLEDCDIPLLLREKLYADFRKGFDDGLRVVLESVAKVSSSVRSRIIDPEFHTDWAVDWGDIDGYFALRITLVEQSRKYPLSVLTEAILMPNESGRARYEKTVRLGLDWFGRSTILEALAEFAENTDLKILLEDQLPKEKAATIKDKGSDVAYEVLITSRWLGEDTGRDLVVNLSGQLVQVRNYIRKTARPLTPEEASALGVTLR